MQVINVLGTLHFAVSIPATVYWSTQSQADTVSLPLHSQVGHSHQALHPSIDPTLQPPVNLAEIASTMQMLAATASACVDCKLGISQPSFAFRALGDSEQHTRLEGRNYMTQRVRVEQQGDVGF